MKVIDLINQSESTAFSFEILPPLKGNSIQKVYNVIDKLKEFDPKYINITSHHSEFIYKTLPDGSFQKVNTRKRTGSVATAPAIQNKYGIPAAITLGQGILESAGGTSYLAVNGNNHCGIKASSEWNGSTICKPGERVKYRKYKSVEQCFADHAKFLSRKRYAPLFLLKITDYKGWARQLKACGYATDPAYAEKLIKVIEKYNLHSFDR